MLINNKQNNKTSQAEHHMLLNHVSNPINSDKHNLNNSHLNQAIGYYVVNDQIFLDLLNELAKLDLEEQKKALDNFYLCHKPWTFIKLLQFIHEKSQTFFAISIQEEIELKIRKCINEILVYSALNSLIHQYSYVSRMGHATIDEISNLLSHGLLCYDECLCETEVLTYPTLDLDDNSDSEDCDIKHQLEISAKPMEYDTKKDQIPYNQAITKLIQEIAKLAQFNIPAINDVLHKNYDKFIATILLKASWIVDAALYHDQESNVLIDEINFVINNAKIILGIIKKNADNSIYLNFMQEFFTKILQRIAHYQIDILNDVGTSTNRLKQIIHYACNKWEEVVLFESANDGVLSPRDVMLIKSYA